MDMQHNLLDHIESVVPSIVKYWFPVTKNNRPWSDNVFEIASPSIETRGT